MARSRTSDYTLGFKKPPKETRFKKGVSGNPKGRPKKTCQPPPPDGLSEEDARTLRLLDEEVSLNVDGHARRMTRGEAVDRALFEQAMAGDIRAIKLLQERRARAFAEKAALEAARGREESAALTVALAKSMRAQKLAEIDSPPAGPAGTAVDAEGPTPGSLEMGKDRGEPGAVAEAGDPLADNMAEECALAAPISMPSRPVPPSAMAGEAPPASGDRIQWGNAPTQPQPPRLRQHRRVSSSEPLIKSPHPHTRHS